MSEFSDGGIGFEFVAVEWWAIVRFQGDWHANILSRRGMTDVVEMESRMSTTT